MVDTSLMPAKEELQAVLEELFDRATLHNEQLQKQLAHVRSRVVQLICENRYLKNEKALFAECYDEQNDM